VTCRNVGVLSQHSRIHRARLDQVLKLLSACPMYNIQLCASVRIQKRHTAEHAAHSNPNRRKTNWRAKHTEKEKKRHHHPHQR
jgi:hypothetical protein